MWTWLVEPQAVQDNITITVMILPDPGPPVKVQLICLHQMQKLTILAIWMALCLMTMGTAKSWDLHWTDIQFMDLMGMERMAVSNEWLQVIL